MCTYLVWSAEYFWLLSLPSYWENVYFLYLSDDQVLSREHLPSQRYQLYRWAFAPNPRIHTPLFGDISGLKGSIGLGVFLFSIGYASVTLQGLLFYHARTRYAFRGTPPPLWFLTSCSSSTLFSGV